jgi:hypothetical protein
MEKIKKILLALILLPLIVFADYSDPYSKILNPKYDVRSVYTLELEKYSNKAYAFEAPILFDETQAFFKVRNFIKNEVNKDLIKHNLFCLGIIITSHEYIVNDVHYDIFELNAYKFNSKIIYKNYYNYKIRFIVTHLDYFLNLNSYNKIRMIQNINYILRLNESRFKRYESLQESNFIKNRNTIKEFKIKKDNYYVMNYYNVKSDGFLSDLLFEFNKYKSIDVVTKFNSGSGHSTSNQHGHKGGPRGPGGPGHDHGGPGNHGGPRGPGHGPK